MKTVKPFLLLALLMLIHQSSYAHALWIQARPTAQKGQSQKVKIFYGEFATGEIEPIDKWYSDVKKFSLWLIGPDQKQEKIEITPEGDHFVANFTPNTEGVYHLSVVHEAAEVAGTTQYEFSSVATVHVGNKSGLTHQQLNNTLKIITAQKQSKIGSATTAKVYLDGNPYANAKVIVTSENGWGKEFTANEAGEITFSPVWKGKYFLEATNVRKGTGESQGKPYENTWQGATTMMYVQ